MNASLTPREYEVARLFALGRTWEQIAAELGVSRVTIADHRHHAMAKADGTMQGVWIAQGWLHVPTELEMAEQHVADAQAVVDRLRASEGVVDVVPAAGPTPAPSLRKVG